MRAERTGTNVDPAAMARSAAPSGRPIGEYLQLDADGATECSWCGHGLAGPGESWKDGATAVRSPLAKSGQNRGVDPDFTLLEHCCPDCGTLLDTEVVWRDDLPLIDEPGVLAGVEA